ncbi:SPASM domain-containing protein [bacterium]|nr:SPASM domain-containing protein [bacterium]
METPYLIQIETITACNATCVMCGMRGLTRVRGRMSWEIFARVIANCKDLGIQYIVPFINGEPLSDKRMVEMLSYIKVYLPEVEIGWFTNGILLTESIIEQLIDIGNIKTFNISIHGGNKETYEEVMCLKWEDMLEKLALLTEINRANNYPFHIKGHLCDFSKTHDSISDFQQLCEDFEIELGICCYSNFGGLIQDEHGEAPFKNSPYQLCERSQRHLYVLWDGTIVSCCFDVNGVNTFGNLNDNSLKELWESESYHKFRQLHLSGKYAEIPICKDCNSNRFRG